MDIYHAPSQESPGPLKYKLNTQMHTNTHINEKIDKLVLYTQSTTKVTSG